MRARPLFLSKVHPVVATILLVRLALVAFGGLASSCNSSLQDADADRDAPMASEVNSTTTPQQLEQKLNACAAEAGCDRLPILKQLWSRGYCNTSSQGTIVKCTREEVADDREITAAFKGQ